MTEISKVKRTAAFYEWILGLEPPHTPPPPAYLYIAKARLRRTSHLVPKPQFIIKVGIANDLADRQHQLRDHFTFLGAAELPSRQHAQALETFLKKEDNYLLGELIDVDYAKELRLEHPTECRLVNPDEYYDLVYTLHQHCTGTPFPDDPDTGELAGALFIEEKDAPSLRL